MEQATLETETPAPRRWNRRRLFWIAVVAAALGTLWGGWCWWYRADFPMPPLPSPIQDQVFLSQEQEAESGPYFAFYSAIYETTESLRYWKVNWETRRLVVEGSVWRDANGNILTFGHDGRLRLSVPPKQKPKFYQLDGSIADELTPEEAIAFVAALDGAPYRYRKVERAEKPFLIGVPFGPRWEEPNLILDGTPWEWHLSYNGFGLLLFLNAKEPEGRFGDIFWSLAPHTP